MKVSILKSNLLPVLIRCASIAKAKSPHPMYQCMLLRATSDGLEGQGSDGIQEVSSTAVVESAEPGVVAVNAKDLVERVRTLPEGLLSLTVAKDRLVVSAGKRKHTLATLPAADFPPLSPVPGDGFTIPQSSLALSLRRAQFAASADPSRPSLHGVRVEFGKGEIVAMATDGHRCSLATMAVEGAEPAVPIIIPSDAVSAILGLLAGADDVRVSVSRDGLFLSMLGSTFSTKLVDGEFPPVRAMYGDPTKRFVIVEKEMILSSLASVEKASPEGDKHGFVKLAFSGGALAITAQGKGAAEDEIAVDYEGTEFVVGLFHKYLADALGACDSETVRLNFGGELDPIWVRPAEGDAVRGLVMPARL